MRACTHIHAHTHAHAHTHTHTHKRTYAHTFARTVFHPCPSALSAQMVRMGQRRLMQQRQSRAQTLRQSQMLRALWARCCKTAWSSWSCRCGRECMFACVCVCPQCCHGASCRVRILGRVRPCCVKCQVGGGMVGCEWVGVWWVVSGWVSVRAARVEHAHIPPFAAVSGT